MPIISPLPYTLTNGTVADATQVMADFDEILNDVNANAAANGANNDITSLTGLTTPLSVAQGGTGGANGGAGGFRNVVRRNGGLEVWQRGTGETASIVVAASTTAYTSDGWYIKTNANQASVVSSQNGIVNGSPHCARVQRNSGQTGTGVITFGFPMDQYELHSILGQFVRLSLTMRAGANWSPASGNISIALNVGTGAPVKFTVGYTGATVAGSLTQALTTTATRYQFSSNAIIPITTAQAEITLTWTPVGTAGTNDYFEIDDVQLELVPAASGYTASNFERLNFGEMMFLCQRHFYKSFDYNAAPLDDTGTAHGGIVTQSVAAFGTACLLSLRYPTPMRQEPTGTLYNPGGGVAAQALNITRTADCTLTSFIYTSSIGLSVICAPPAGTAAGDVIMVCVSMDASI